MLGKFVLCLDLKKNKYNEAMIYFEISNGITWGYFRIIHTVIFIVLLWSDVNNYIYYVIKQNDEIGEKADVFDKCRKNHWKGTSFSLYAG